MVYIFPPFAKLGLHTSWPLWWKKTVQLDKVAHSRYVVLQEQKVSLSSWNNQAAPLQDVAANYNRIRGKTFAVLDKTTKKQKFHPSKLPPYTVCDQIWKKKPASTHTISNLRFHQNGLLAQYTIIFHCVPCSKVTSLVSVAVFLIPCVSLEWRFGAIRRWWLSCIGAWRAGQATKGWPVSVIFNLECCEHKKGSLGPQTGSLAFNCLHIPFCTPILSPPSTTHPPPLLLPCAISLLPQKSCSKQLEFWVLESYLPTQL